MAQQISVNNLVTGLVFILVGVALIGPIGTQITAANITDASTAVIVGLIPLIYGVALLLNVVRTLM